MEGINRYKKLIMCFLLGPHLYLLLRITRNLTVFLSEDSVSMLNPCPFINTIVAAHIRKKQDTG